jgi:hypothetical protein
MHRKVIIFLTRLFLLGVTLVFLALFFVPATKYVIMGEQKLTAKVVGDSATYAWLVRHSKFPAPAAGTTPDILFVADASEDFSQDIGDNLVFGEQLLDGPNADMVQHVFNFDATGFVGFADEKGLRIEQGKMTWELVQGVDYVGEFGIKSAEGIYPFHGWFEFVRGDNVIDYYHLNLTDTGREKLAELGLEDKIPLTVAYSSPLYDAYYCTGRIAPEKVSMPFFVAWAEVLFKNKQIYEKQSNEAYFWQQHYDQLQETITAGRQFSNLGVSAREPLFVTQGRRMLKLDSDGEYQDFFFNGVNVGVALPGQFFTDFSRDVEVYRFWLRSIGEMNANTVRIYTLLPPEFYRALYEHNQVSSNKLYLMQEIWPEENPVDHNYLLPGYNEDYQQEIEIVVDAVHGSRVVPQRDYRAFGVYSYDVSPYLIGYLVGRELEPEEVIATDMLNPEYTYPDGRYIFAEAAASPTEAWLAASCDYALAYEDSVYGQKSLAGIVNWPTLDPIDHPSEWNEQGDKSLQYNDKAVVNINHIGLNPDNAAGFFGAYHIYPNYPNFMNNEPAYNAYQDGQGRFRYGGYLRQFMELHTKFPAVVAEYGLSNSKITAHVSPDGYNHGGLDEATQAAGTIRMAEAIKREGYAGAIIFEWMDEWAKKTWITEPYMIPYQRHALWHNAMDPEQNYGILAVEGLATLQEKTQDSLTVRHNYTYVQLELTENAANPGKDRVVLLSTIGDDNPEFKIVIPAGQTPSILASARYNWTRNIFVGGSPEAEFQRMILVTNPSGIGQNGEVYPAISIDVSDLQPYVHTAGNKLRIDLPYTLIGVSDPSSLQVMSGVAASTTTEGILVILQEDGAQTAAIRYLWEPWEKAEFTYRFKQIYYDLMDYFKD